MEALPSSPRSAPGVIRDRGQARGPAVCPPPPAGLSALTTPAPVDVCPDTFTLSISSARQHRDGFARSRQVLEEDLLGVRLRHFHGHCPSSSYSK